MSENERFFNAFSVVPQAWEDFTRRALVEQEKAVAKYGADALRPEGNTALDVYDYALNELSGLKRYGELIAGRTNALCAEPFTGALRLKAEAKEIQRLMHHASVEIGVKLEKLRLELKARGFDLGAAETR
jgi:hypothetical protein